MLITVDFHCRHQGCQEIQKEVMYYGTGILIFGGINHEYESSFRTHFITCIICSINHEQWCDDCILLNMYFNKYIKFTFMLLFLYYLGVSEYIYFCVHNTERIHVHVRLI